ncbi:hypothetical protein [Rheinheimera aquimaris]|uniref:hypothetical protein n=1 Tax=Rheinheimera aquimaris TaxID=412437 RepID=UPI001E56C915|nr:hypothetical protein [Rheinheimera aquimaris]MCD1596900.1 hypothetical protein [Rheinheimera aquimaris]
MKQQAGKLTFYGWLLAVLATVLYLLLSAPSVHWNTNISAAMPGSVTGWQQQLLKQNNSSRHISLLLSGQTIAELRQVAAQLQQRQISQLHWVEPGVAMHQLQTVYQQHQALLASPQQLTLLRNGEYQPLVDAALQRLYSPAPLLPGALQQDPLLLTQQKLEQYRSQSGLQLRQHWFELKQQGQSALLLMAALETDPFDRGNASAIATALEQQLQQLQQQWPMLTVARSGVLFHAVVAAERASFEMQFYGGMSLAAILLLLWFSFRSWRPLLLALTTLGCASAFGLAAVLLVFKQPHILGLVFATTLIGIAIDYSFHGMLAANQGQAAFRRMLPSLLLGLLTTVLGYLALVLLPLPVLNQVAVFICAGLLAAFITVYIVFPRWLPANSMQVSPAFLRCCAAISRCYTRVPAKAVLLVALPALLAIGGSLVYLMQFNDDVRLFNQSPQALIAQERQVRSVGGQNWDSRFIVVLGDSYQQLLQREQQLQPQLQRWQQQAKLTTWQSTVQSVPPLQQQTELQQLLQQAYRSDAVQQYLTQLQLSPPPTTQQWLTPERLPADMLQQIQPLQDAQAQFVSVTLLKDVALNADDIALLQQYQDTYWFDPIADTNTSLQHLRSQLSLWLVLALCSAVVLLGWRLGIRPAAAIVLLLLLAIGSALLISLLLQQQLNIFNLVAALLVLALALDYGIFFTARLQHQEVVQAVLLSATTSSLAFGLLSFSSTPAIASFGLTVFLGVALSCTLAPLLSVMVVRESEKRAAL